jgi:hypothetical protein
VASETPAADATDRTLVRAQPDSRNRVRAAWAMRDRVRSACSSRSVERYGRDVGFSGTRPLYRFADRRYID